LRMMATGSVQRTVEIVESVVWCRECGGKIPLKARAERDHKILF